ncbi:hypothetical protein GCM10023200_19730 [Actinomycetospora chlora]|uniref:histidine kinase n=1 Tax=Actinomycetospora chlora TaxID=663608 RepID=A0ABP9ATD8_9PSEU
MTDDLVDALLAEWPGRWRHPALSAELTSGGTRADLDRAANLLVASLARPRSYAESLDALLSEGRFEIAETLLLDLLEQSPAPDAGGDRWQAAADRLAAARADALADLRRSWADLESKAAALGLAPAPEPPLAAATQRSRDDGRQLLETEIRRVGGAEEALAVAVERRIAEELAASDSAGWATSWAEAVRNCMRAEEFRVVRELLRAGPGASVDAGPRTVEPPPLRWPWPGHPADEVLGWYRSTGRSPGPEFERYRPLSTDEAWPRLLDALGRILGPLDGPTVLDLAVALAALLGEQAAPPVEAVTDDRTGRVVGYRTRLFGLHDARMPVLPLLGLEGVALWISVDDDGGTSAVEPIAVVDPDIGALPVVWFRPCTRAARSAADHVAVVDLADLFLLVAPDARRRTPSATTRRVNLLRLLVPQLAPTIVLGGPALDLGPGAAPRDSLAWLFDLCGLRPDGPVLDGVLHDTAGHRVALRCVLEMMMTDSLETEEARVGLPALRAIRSSERHAAIRAALIAPLAHDAAARTVLWLALWPDGDDPLEERQVLATLNLVEVPTEVQARISEHLHVSRAITTLCALGLLRCQDGGVRPPASGLRLILRGDDDTVRTAATEAVIETAESIRVSARAAAAVLGERVTHTIGHSLDNRVTGIRRDLEQMLSRTADPQDRAALEAIRLRVQGLGGGAYVNAYEAALEPPTRTDVTDVVRAVVGEVDWNTARPIRIRSEMDSPVWVVANSWLLNEALTNLVRNAEAAQEEADGPSTIRIRVVVHAAPPQPASTLPVPPPCVAVEVADGGPGFTAEALRRYSAVLYAGIDAGEITSADVVEGRTGTGLLSTQTWLQDYGGTLELAGHSDLGGACVRMWLPVDVDPTPGGSG